MFITRKRLEEIKDHERWEFESKLNREREIRDIHEEIWELRRRLDKLEGKTNPVPEGVYANPVPEVVYTNGNIASDKG